MPRGDSQGWARVRCDLLEQVREWCLERRDWLLTFTPACAAQVVLAAIFDLLISSADRTLRNVMVTEAGQLLLIDNDVGNSLRDSVHL